MSALVWFVIFGAIAGISISFAHEYGYETLAIFMAIVFSVSVIAFLFLVLATS